jgi:hypothetical protein
MKKLTTLINEELAPDKLREQIGTISEALKKMFASYSLPVVLEAVQINEDVITVECSITFENETTDFDIHFYVSDEIPFALVQADDEDEEDFMNYSLENIASKIDGDEGEVVNLVDPSWLEESVFMAILSSDLEAELEEKFQFVIRGGKKVKKKLVRNKRRKVLTAKQRAGIKKATRSRKAKKGQTARKRKISNKLRKRMKLGKNKDKNLKVAGTSGKKR